MEGLSILGTGSYVPSFAVTNQMLEGIVDTSDEWIITRTGIRRRALAGEKDTALSMSLGAAEQAIEDAGISVSEIGVVVVATLSGDYITPSLSCLLQRELGLREDLIALDINCACSGFVFAAKTALSLLENQPGKKALIVGCELLSRIVDYTDRATCILFGDGAGAAVLSREKDRPFCFDSGVIGNSEMLVCRAQYLANAPFCDRAKDRMTDGIYMNGTEVFRFALEKAPASIHRVLEKSGLAAEDIDHFVFHQANARIIDGIIKRLKIPAEKCIVNLSHLGNTSSASVAIALSDLRHSGRLTCGDKVVISAFGGGLAYASAYFIW